MKKAERKIQKLKVFWVLLEAGVLDRPISGS